MSDYLLRVIGTVLVCSLITAIAPEGKTLGNIKGIAKLVCVLAIVAPVLGYFKRADVSGVTDKNRQNFFGEDVIQVDGTFIEYYSEMRVHYAEEALEKELLAKYALDTKVTLDWRMDKEIKIQCICIKLLQNTDEEVKKEMWQYLTENYSSEVLIE